MPGSNSRPNVSEGYEVPTELPGSTGYILGLYYACCKCTWCNPSSEVEFLFCLTANNCRVRSAHPCDYAPVDPFRFTGRPRSRQRFFRCHNCTSTGKLLQILIPFFRHHTVQYSGVTYKYSTYKLYQYMLPLHITISCLQGRPCENRQGPYT